MQMYRKLNQIRNASEVTINPATEATLQSVVDSNVWLSPVCATPLAVTSTAAAYTLVTGNSLIVQNVGAKMVYFGGSAVTSTNGIRLTPTQGWEFKGCKAGFKIFFATNGADTSTVNICEF